MPDQRHPREFSAFAQIICQRNRVVGVVLEAEILRAPELRQFDITAKERLIPWGGYL